MAYIHDYDITRDGFTYAYGMFYAQPGRVARVEGLSLRDMFLPKLTPKGRKQLKACYSDYFVRAQLKHYGVPVDENEICGYGTLFMTKALQDGKCDAVPDHITELRQQMHTDWLQKTTHEQISGFPAWAIEKYFLSSGQPDRTKTTTVVKIACERSSDCVSRVREAAGKVPGLHHGKGLGPRTETVFLGWDSVAVSKAADTHAADEERVVQAAMEKRENERIELHTKYLNILKQKKSLKGPQTFSPIGSYFINCKEIEEQWPDQTEKHLTIDIRRTDEPGVFEASFDFGILEGAMVLSAEKDALKGYCAQLDYDAGVEESMSGDEDEDDDEDDEEDDESDENDGGEGWRVEKDGEKETDEEVEGQEEKDEEAKGEDGAQPAGENEAELENGKTRTTSLKRKAEEPEGHGRPPKKPAAQTLTYFLKLKCRETGEGEVCWNAESGTIDFKDETLTTFTAQAVLPWVGDAVPFSGRKKSEAASRPEHSWADF